MRLPSERTTEIVDISWISVRSDAVISQRNLAMHPVQGRVILSVEQPFERSGFVDLSLIGVDPDRAVVQGFHHRRK